jgi:hypothetical protein
MASQFCSPKSKLFNDLKDPSNSLKEDLENLRGLSSSLVAFVTKFRVLYDLSLHSQFFSEISLDF